MTGNCLHITSAALASAKGGRIARTRAQKNRMQALCLRMLNACHASCLLTACSPGAPSCQHKRCQTDEHPCRWFRHVMDRPVIRRTARQCELLRIKARKLGTVREGPELKNPAVRNRNTRTRRRFRLKQHRLVEPVPERSRNAKSGATFRVLQVKPQEAPGICEGINPQVSSSEDA